MYELLKRRGAWGAFLYLIPGDDFLTAILIALYYMPRVFREGKRKLRKNQKMIVLKQFVFEEWRHKNCGWCNSVSLDSLIVPYKKLFLSVYNH